MSQNWDQNSGLLIPEPARGLLKKVVSAKEGPVGVSLAAVGGEGYFLAPPPRPPSSCIPGR